MLNAINYDFDLEQRVETDGCEAMPQTRNFGPVPVKPEKSTNYSFPDLYRQSYTHMSYIDIVCIYYTHLCICTYV